VTETAAAGLYRQQRILQVSIYWRQTASSVL
jgi:hypothetical protein